MIGYNLLTVALEFNTIPFFLFSPTNIQPSVSLDVLPECIRIPSNEGTFNNLGVNRLYLGEYAQTTS